MFGPHTSYLGHPRTTRSPKHDPYHKRKKTVTYGEELLGELGKLIPVDSYLSAEQQEKLRRVWTKDHLADFLDEMRLGGVATDGDVADVAANLAPIMRFDSVAETLGCEGCLFIPFALQIAWLVDAFRLRRVRFSLADVLTFVALFAVCLSYEVSIAPVFLGMPQQLLLALPVAMLFGAFPSYFFKNARWVLVSLDVIVLMEAVAFVIWLRR